MSKRRLMLGAAGAALACLCGGAAVGDALRARPASAQAPRETRAAAQRWEHCSATTVNGHTTEGERVTGAAVIHYVRGGGLQAVRVEETVAAGAGGARRAANAALAKAVGRLGDEGWEMVGEGTLLPDAGDGGRVLYFRRPRP